MNMQQPTDKSGEAVRSIELLPCPWCGGEAIVEKECTCWICRILGTSRQVRCVICNAGKTGDTEDEAIKKWQHRWQGNDQAQRPGLAATNQNQNE